MQWLEWYRIVAYRDFHDVPRYVLVTNTAEDDYWILDAGFDEAVDNDSPIYLIRYAASSLDEATACFDRPASDETAVPAFGCIPVAHVEFDETRRGALKLTSPPIT